MTRPDRDGGEHRDPSEVPWHNRTSTLLGASVVGLAVIAALVAGGLWLGRQFTEPQQAPLNYVDPTFSSTSEQASSTPTTTETITSTSPPVTSDINPDSTTPTTTDSETSSTSRTPRTSRPSDDDDNDDATTTTRKRPRTNVTRTLYPGT
ncbi:hypothetical protein [Mycolicibacterium sp. 018/SC-01/001]|uniref:hypothetical protein n=1 Tax=Mycolicibacterium sp. 018/SC-01/001 TaxID=2592069 RepID=UPI003519DE23